MNRLFLLILLIVPCFALADGSEDFEKWRDVFRLQAKSAGISEQTLQNTLDQTTYNPHIITLDHKQPEQHKTFDQYAEGILSADRINEGRSLYHEHYQLLHKIALKYHVQPQYILALWGIETDFGKITGNFDIVNSLTTLAYEGRRRELFQKELLAALTMIDRHLANPEDMKGSWAGAMGQTQFMPSSFLKFAVDYTGKGQADIWHNLPDVFASIANYLSQTGWDDTLPWGRAVKLPAGFDHSLAKINLEKPSIEWQDMGVRLINGNALPPSSQAVSIIIPGDGKPNDGKRAFLVYRNYKTLMDWNKSTFFATTVGLLANSIAEK